MPLEQYHRKRDFGKTPEPAGDPGAAGGTGRFVVQRHRATRLHYDFRLEIGGLLASWAIPKGPTLDPAIRRMAVHVEDHPIEYFDFEGVIPRGQYGAGDVIVWDWGTFVPEAETPDPVKAVEDGELKFELHGEKLRGRFTIVRTSRRPGSAPTTAFEDDSEQWLLIKKRDSQASAGWDAEELPQSVKTGRTNDEVQAKREALWMSDMPAAAAEIDLEGAVEAPLKGFVQPMLATLATNAFDDPDWLRRWKEVGVDDRDANTHLVADEVAELCWLGNQASFEVHAWTGKLPRPDRPTFALVDIDPGEKTTWNETLEIARLYRAAFEHLGLRAYPKVTGKRGIQAWLPIVPK